VQSAIDDFKMNKEESLFGNDAAKENPVADL
jgi:hypothetical protein